MQSSRRDEVAISGELMEKLLAIPDKRQGTSGRDFTPEMDAAILRFYESKPKKPLAKALGIGQERLKERYAFLKQVDSGEEPDVV